MAVEWELLTPSRRELDLSDGALTEAYVRSTKPDIVVHAAGRVGGIQANIANPVAFLVENIDMGRNLLLACRDAGVRRFLNLGSSCMYPRDRSDLLREDDLLSGALETTNEGYALAKIFSTRLCEYISREDESFHYKTLIPCNIYGRHDKFDPAVSHLIPAVIRKVHDAKLRGEGEVAVWGDGQARREFMYAEDLADAVMRAAADITIIPPLMNIGIGRDYTIDEYYRMAAVVIGWDGELRHDISKPAGMLKKQVDISKQRAWGWSPTHSLMEGIAKTYDFFLKGTDR
ncbi:NAD-dependent epimerase/dehydratase family protein [Sphingobium sp. MI1205]|uniref:NAD-dependent epimerase/dehydratase family protein n=1 Tax=Sphingobium sp. MI1205 TaxID=407020 RepID=UPI000B0B7DB3|nr:NAD-dependent epimerase/dehydratase family protein [Sphingobium sp. MI1205]